MTINLGELAITKQIPLALVVGGLFTLGVWSATMQGRIAALEKSSAQYERQIQEISREIRALGTEISREIRANDLATRNALEAVRLDIAGLKRPADGRRYGPDAE